MKVLFWLNTFLPDLGGIQSFTADLMPHLIDKGHEITMIADHGRKMRPPFSYHGDVPVHTFNMIRPVFSKNLAGIVKARKGIVEVIREVQPDLVHMHTCGPEIFYFLQIFKNISTPTLTTIHNNYSQIGIDPSEKTGFGKMLSKVDYITTVSQNSLDWLLSSRPDLESKSEALINGISFQEHDLQPLPWDPPIVLYLGRIDEQKRIDLLLKSFQLTLPNVPNAKLRIVGDGTLLDEQIALASELGIQDSVEFLGRIDHSEVPDMLNQATVLVLSSDFEGLPIAALEAHQMGRPIVSTDVGGMGELVIHGETGLLVKKGDVVGFADALSSVLQNREMTESFGEAAKQHVKIKFSMEECAAKYNDIYRALGQPTGEYADG
ncbi:MAG: glycosyltransferase family 4 protein [Chloroflexota bacterium]